MKTYPLLGIYGGTFDPIHNGHCHVMRSCLPLLSWERFLVIPSHIPPLKPHATASKQDRVAMLKLAIKEFAGKVTLDARELQREGPSYTIDTVKSLQQDYPGEIPVIIFGDDVFASLPEWQHWEDLIKHCHLIIINRRHDTPYHPALREHITSREVSDITTFTQHPGGKLFFLQVPTVDLSSTELRDKLATHQSIANLVPNTVNQYISKHRLYI
jgi:nicotinate-nucleotide adenylyltransferase